MYSRKMQASERQHCDIMRPIPNRIPWLWEVLHFFNSKSTHLGTAVVFLFFSNALKITSLFSFQWTLLPPSLLYMWIGLCLECWRRASVSPCFITSPNSLIITYSQSHMDLIHCSSEPFRAERCCGSFNQWSRSCLLWSQASRWGGLHCGSWWMAPG